MQEVPFPLGPMVQVVSVSPGAADAVGMVEFVEGMGLVDYRVPRNGGVVE